RFAEVVDVLVEKADKPFGHANGEFRVVDEAFERQLHRIRNQHRDPAGRQRSEKAAAVQSATSWAQYESGSPHLRPVHLAQQPTSVGVERHKLLPDREKLNSFSRPRAAVALQGSPDGVRVRASLKRNVDSGLSNGWTLSRIANQIRERQHTGIAVVARCLEHNGIGKARMDPIAVCRIEEDVVGWTAHKPGQLLGENPRLFEAGQGRATSRGNGGERRDEEFSLVRTPVARRYFRERPRDDA